MNKSLKYLAFAAGAAAAIAAIVHFSKGDGISSPRACTMEAKICPDGSAVGRSGPNCEFAPCPTVKSTPPTPVKY